MTINGLTVGLMFLTVFGAMFADYCFQRADEVERGGRDGKEEERASERR